MFGSISRAAAKAFDGFAFQLRPLIGLQICALNQNLKSIAYFVAHAFTRHPAGFAAAQFANMQLGKQGSNQASDQGYGDTMEPPRPAPSVEFDQSQPSAEDGNG